MQILNTERDRRQLFHIPHTSQSYNVAVLIPQTRPWVSHYYTILIYIALYQDIYKSIDFPRRLHYANTYHLAPSGYKIFILEMSSLYAIQVWCYCNDEICRCPCSLVLVIKIDCKNGFIYIHWCYYVVVFLGESVFQYWNHEPRKDFNSCIMLFQ